MMNDILRHSAETDKIIYGIGYTTQMPDLLGVWYDTWTNRRVDMNLRRRYLVAKEKVGTYAVKQSLTEVRILPKDLHFPSSIIIYGKRSAIFYPQEKEFTGIIIESEGIAKSNKNFFEALWRKSSKI